MTPQEDQWTAFLSAPSRTRLRLVLEPQSASMIRTYLGDGAFEEYASLARKVGLGTASVFLPDVPTNLIFVPGLMGSLLRSRTLGGVWWIDPRTRHHLEDLRLANDGATDIDRAYEIIPFAIDTAYEPFFAAVLERADFGHEAFPYDWRKPLALSAAALRDLIVRTYSTNGRRKVHLVAHSMGGLMVRATLRHHSRELDPIIGSIVFIGTPHYGAPATASYVRNHFWGTDYKILLGLYVSRAAFRSLRGVLSLLPAPRGIYPGTRAADPQPWTSNQPSDAYIHPAADFDLYAAGSWRLDLDAQGEKQFQRTLDAVATVHRQHFAAHHRLPKRLRDRMAVIAGVGQKTLFRMEELLPIGLAVRHVTTRIPGDIHREGDGTVPLASALLEHVGETRYVRGTHGALPNLPMVYDDVFRFLNGEPMQLPSRASTALGNVVSLSDQTSTGPTLDGSAQRSQDEWQEAPPDPSRIDHLQSLLARDQLADFTRIRLL